MAESAGKEDPVEAVPSAARALLGRPRLSTTRSYPGNASNRFRSKTKKVNEGDLFCNDILSFIGGESSVEDNEDGYTP